MPTTGIVSVSDGSRLTVSDLVGNPLWIPTKLKQIIANQFISEALFRDGGPNPNGVVAYREGDPLFLEDDVADVAEFGAIPVSASGRGTPRVAFATKKALGIRVSKEMIDENNMGEVNRQMSALRNTFIRANDRAARQLVTSNAIPTLAVANAWDTANGNPRNDLLKGQAQMQTAAPLIADGGSDDESYGFDPDTIVMHPGIASTMLQNAKFQAVYGGDAATQNPLFTGQLPGNFYGMAVLKSYAFPLNKVLLLERGTFGFYSDTRPLQFTGLYPEGNGPNGGPTESWRSDASHKRALGVDQPKAALWLTGVMS